MINKTKFMLIDSHTHVHFEDFKNDADAVVRRALEQDIWLVNVGTDLKTSQEATALAHRYEQGVFSAIGIHPHDAQQDVVADQNNIFQELLRLGQDKKVVGIGECGLDFFRLQDQKVKIKQRELFERHIALAQAAHKPLSIHCREAHDDMHDLLRAHRNDLLVCPGVMHFFTGSIQEARTYLDLGFYISFSGVITFTHDYDEVVRFVPRDRIVIETDAPFVAPVPFRGKRNEPSFVRYTADVLANILNENQQSIYDLTFKNTKKLFNLD